MLLLARARLVANNEGLSVGVVGASHDRVLDALNEIRGEGVLPPVELLSGAKNILREKWDWVLPEDMARRSFASLCLDFAGAKEVACQLCEMLPENQSKLEV